MVTCRVHGWNLSDVSSGRFWAGFQSRAGAQTALARILGVCLVLGFIFPLFSTCQGWTQWQRQRRAVQLQLSLVVEARGEQSSPTARSNCMAGLFVLTPIADSFRNVRFVVSFHLASRRPPKLVTEAHADPAETSPQSLFHPPRPPRYLILGRSLVVRCPRLLPSRRGVAGSSPERRGNLQMLREGSIAAPP